MTEPIPPSDDLLLVERLRAGDEAAFMSVVEQLQPAMLRVARMYVSTTAVAEEAVQDAWLGVLRGLDRFEGRSSLRTWIFRILTDIAKTRGRREGGACRSHRSPVTIWQPLPSIRVDSTRRKAPPEVGGQRCPMIGRASPRTGSSARRHSM